MSFQIHSGQVLSSSSNTELNCTFVEITVPSFHLHIFFGTLASGRENFFRKMCVQGQRVWVMALCFFEQTWAVSLSVCRQNASAIAWPHAPCGLWRPCSPQILCSLFWRGAPALALRCSPAQHVCRHRGFSP